MYNCPQKRKHCTLVVRIIAKRTLREFWERHPNAKQPLASWYDRVRRTDWDTPANVRAQFPKASIVGSNRAVFRIKGNTYRLVVEINYVRGLVFIRFIGTHAEYDRIDVEEV